MRPVLKMFVRNVVRKSGLLRLRQDIRCRTVTKRSVELRPEVPLGSQRWSRLISRAEEQANCPHTFTTQDWLLVDELTQDSPVFLRKLLNQIPSSYSEVNAINESPTSVPWALVVLLLAKAYHHNLNHQDDIIHEKIKFLSKLTEIVRIGHSLHDKIFNLIDENLRDSFEVSNKVSLLMGDYFLSKTLHILFEKIQCTEVSVAILSAIRDLSESKFVGTRDAQNVPFPYPPNPILHNDVKNLNSSTTIDYDAAENEWTRRSILNGASLLGRSCESVMMLLNQSKTLQMKSYQFGIHSGLAWQAASEIASFSSPSSETYSLVGAPVLLALREEPNLYDYIFPGKRGSNSIDYEGLRSDINKTNAVARTRRMCLNHVAQAKAILDEYIGNNVASRTLNSMLSISLLLNK